MLIDRLYNLGVGDAGIAKKLGVSRQRVHQLRTGYSSPSSRKNLHPSELKRLTKRKRGWLLMSDEEFNKVRGRIPGGRIPKGITRSLYHSIHHWLNKTYGKATLCENKDCLKKANRFEWALRKGFKYERNRDNFIMMCRSCHAKMDLPGSKELKRQNLVNAPSAKM